jgi:hypothetical protein
MKYLKRIFEDVNRHDFSDLLLLNITNEQILEFIKTRFLNDEFLKVYDETNYPEMDIAETIINRNKSTEVPYLQIKITLESLFEFEKSPEGIEQLKKHLQGQKTLTPKKNGDDKSKNRIFPSLTLDILLTIHKDRLFCRIDGDFSIYIGDFPLLSHSVEKNKFVTTKEEVIGLYIDILNNLNIYSIHEIQELNK